MSYDPRCYELAEYFMPNDSTDHREALAQHIQDCLEDWLTGFREQPSESSGAQKPGPGE